MNYNEIMDNIIDNEYMNKTEFSKKFDELCGEKDKLKAITLLVEKYNCDFDDARMVCDYIIDGTLPPSNLSPQEQSYNNAVAQEWLNKPKCPICQSTNLSKISTTKKVAKIAAFGVFGMGDNGKTWKCNNCGSKF